MGKLELSGQVILGASDLEEPDLDDNILIEVVIGDYGSFEVWLPEKEAHAALDVVNYGQKAIELLRKYKRNTPKCYDHACVCGLCVSRRDCKALLARIDETKAEAQ